MGTKTATPSLWLSGLVFWATLASSSQVNSSTAEIKPPDLNFILQRLEEIQHQNPAQSRPYEVTREYKVFRGQSTQPTSEVMAQIDFIPPDKKTYRIVRARGNSRGERMVRELLDQETESAKKKRSSEISRTNYDFVFLRRENFSDVPAYVLGIVPKRKDKLLLRGQIWLDASTFRIRRIEGTPAKSPSFWLKNIHVTLQFAQLGGMWVPVSFDAIATVRFLGQYTLAGLNVRSSESLSTAPEQPLNASRHGNGNPLPIVLDLVVEAGERAGGAATHGDSTVSVAGRSVWLGLILNCPRVHIFASEAGVALTQVYEVEGSPAQWLMLVRIMPGGSADRIKRIWRNTLR